MKGTRRRKRNKHTTTFLFFGFFGCVHFVSIKTKTKDNGKKMKRALVLFLNKVNTKNTNQRGEWKKHKGRTKKRALTLPSLVRSLFFFSFQELVCLLCAFFFPFSLAYFTLTFLFIVNKPRERKKKRTQYERLTFTFPFFLCSIIMEIKWSMNWTKWKEKK